MKKIIFEGYYGQENTGDDSFLEVSAWGAEKYWQSENNFFVSKNLPKIKHAAKGLQQKIIPGQHQLESILRLRNADAMISAGGSTFEKIKNKTHIRNVSLLKKKYSLDFKLGAIGVSLGPYKNTRHENAIVEYLRQMDFLALRDQHSYNIALSYNLPYEVINAFDLAALLPSIYNIQNTDKREAEMKTIGVSVCYFERYRGVTDLTNENRRVTYIMELLTTLSRRLRVKFRLIEFNGNIEKGDRYLTLSLISFLKSRKIKDIEFVPYSPDTSFMYQKLVECDLVLSIRLHASVFACFANVPFFLVEYHRKCGDFLDSVGYHQAYRLGDGIKEIKETVDQMEEILKDKANYIRPSSVENCRIMAEKNFTHISL